MSAAFSQQHVDDILGVVITEQLPQFLFMKGDAVALNKANEIIRAVTGEGRFGEMGIAGKEIVRAAIPVGEIAPTAAGNADFFSHLAAVINQQNRFPAGSGDPGKEQSCGTGPDYNDILRLTHLHHTHDCSPTLWPARRLVKAIKFSTGLI